MCIGESVLEIKLGFKFPLSILSISPCSWADCWLRCVSNGDRIAVETHAIERNEKKKETKKRIKEKKEPTSRYIPTNSNAAILLEPVPQYLHACYVTRPLLQARHVADFRAGELACEYKTPCIGSQKGMGGGEAGRQTGFESACQNHFSWSAAAASPPLVRRIQASFARRDAAYRALAPE